MFSYQEQFAHVEDIGEDLEQVEVMQKKFDDFNADLKANEVRLAEMNEIAMQLMSLGQTEAALKIQTQMEDLNRKWVSLQQLTAERAQQLGSAISMKLKTGSTRKTKFLIMTIRARTFTTSKPFSANTKSCNETWLLWETKSVRVVVCVWLYIFMAISMANY